MLIIAIPKSASTSLMLTFSRLHKLKARQDFSVSKKKIPQNCNIIHQFHSDIREFEDLEKYDSPNLIFKQHLYPSNNNLNLAQNIKKVVLLRDPIEIILAYRRGSLQGIHNLLEGYSIEMSESEWIALSKLNGLFSDLDFFYKEWYSKANPENTLFIQYYDYINNPKKTINRIEEFFDLQITDKRIKSVRARYSRRSKFGNLIFINLNKALSFVTKYLSYLKTKPNNRKNKTGIIR